MPSTKELLKENRVRALLSKENRGSAESGETSFRVYYGATGAAVPFMWESQPGTPKHPIFTKNRVENQNDDSVPPLTPPPSYTTTNISSSPMTLGHTTRKRRKSFSSRRIFDVFFSSSSRKNSDVTPSSSLSSPLSWSTASSSSSSSLSSSGFHRRSVSFCSFGAKSPLFGDEDHRKSMGSPDSATMCFNKKYQGCYSLQHMKNVVLSFRGQLKN